MDRGRPCNKKGRLIEFTCKWAAWSEPSTLTMFINLLYRILGTFIGWYAHTHMVTYEYTQRLMGVSRCCPHKWPLFYSKVSVHMGISKPGAQQTESRCVHTKESATDSFLFWQGRLWVRKPNESLLWLQRGNFRQKIGCGKKKHLMEASARSTD